MTPDQAADLAARTLAAITETARHAVSRYEQACADDHRERVASDLAGLRDHAPYLGDPDRGCRHDAFGRMQYGGPRPWSDCPDAARYADNLRRTAALYGVTP